MSVYQRGGPARSRPTTHSILHSGARLVASVLGASVDAFHAVVEAGLPGRTEFFLREVAAVPEEEVAIMRSFPPVWERATAGVHNGPRDLRSFSAQPVDLDAVRRITVPVLLLVGSEQDAPIYLDGLDEIEQALPNARRDVRHGCVREGASRT